MKTLQGIVQDKDPVVELVSGGTETEREREREGERGRERERGREGERERGVVISSNEEISKLS